MEDGVDTSLQAGNSLSVAHIAPKWPVETEIVFSDGRTKIGLVNQNLLVRMVLQDAIENVHVNLLFRHSFPDPDGALSNTETALLDATRARLPRTAAILDRLQSDKNYLANMSVIVSLTYHATALLTLSIAACSDPNYSRGDQRALQRYGRS